MALSTKLYDPFDAFDPFLTVSVPSVSRELTRDDTGVGWGLIRPKMDLKSCKNTNEMMATFELPGLKKDDVEIDLRNNRLVISGQSSTSEDVDTDDYALHERRIGKFSRALPIPTGTKPEDIKAHLENGLLTVTFPKTQPEQEAKRIAIA